MSKPKYKKGDWVIVKPSIEFYGGEMGQIIRVTPPHFGSSPVTVYTVKFNDGGIDDFTGLELKTPTSEQSQRYSMDRLKEGFAIADQLFHKGAKEAEHSFINSAKKAFEKTSVEKDIEWSDFKSEADKEWEAFIK